MPMVSTSWNASLPMRWVATWDRIHHRGGDAGHRIRGAGTRGHQHHAGLAGGARIPVGGMGRPLLVAHQDVRHLGLAEQGVVDVQHGAAGVAEDMAHALVAQEADDDFGTGEFHGQGLHERQLNGGRSAGKWAAKLSRTRPGDRRG
jgi:hypothetical protein